jgi:hypothetical protein
MSRILRGRLGNAFVACVLRYLGTCRHPALPGEDLKWIILYVLLSTLWLGLILFIAPTYFEDTMITARLSLLSGEQSLLPP